MLPCKCMVSCMKHTCKLDLNRHPMVEHAGCVSS